ncbi:MAG TPA: hypothetical protein VLA74_01140 [Nitrososphaeraceae archaeon]|nr:hypothetical protein [Nitrososphaeraceae archaeon]
MKVEEWKEIRSKDRTLELESGIKTLLGEFEEKIKITEKQAFRMKTKNNLRYEQLCSELGIYDDIVKGLEELLK